MKRVWGLLFVSALGCSDPESSVCGDQVVEAPEACDDGNAINEDGCRNNCELPACGDGIVDAGELCLSSPVSVLVGGAFALVNADFNNDGAQDIAVTNQGDDQLNLLLGDGQGGFGPPTIFDAGDLPSSLVAGDFDQDGNQDLAISNPFDNAISVLLGDGQGSFAPRASLDGVGDFNMLGADLNNDGELDLISTSIDGANVLLGDGQGSFGAATFFAMEDSPQIFTLGDLNNDGNQDLAAAIGRGQFDPSRIDVLLGDGQGGFGAPVPSAVELDLGSLVAGDFDTDGAQDLVTSSIESVRLSLGDGQGSFVSGNEFECGGLIPGSAAARDMNGDGFVDAIVSNQTLEDVSAVTVLLGDGAGVLGAPIVLAEVGFPEEIAIGDFNADAVPDLATTTFDGQDSFVTIFLSNP